MRTSFRCFLLLVLLNFSKLSWAQFSDDFSDGDFTSNPSWSGDVANFVVDANLMLRLNAPAVSDTSYLSVPNQAIDDAVWEFLVEMDFNPSSSNLARVYLVSNNTDLRAPLNGYYVRLGGETEDRISLYRQTGTTSTSLITSADGLLNTDPSGARVRVTRSANADWELLADTSGGTAFVSLGTVNDTVYFQNFYSGVWCKYTSTRSDKFYFDDFSVTGNPFLDQEPPAVVSVSVLSDTQIDVLFTEPVDQATAQNTGNYTGDNGLGNPLTAVVDGVDPSLVHLSFGTTFQNGTTYQLSILNVQDLVGNAMTPTTESFIYVIPTPANYRDVVINEFMCDPSPVQGLAEAEYVEIFNRSGNYIDISGWKLGDASSLGTIGQHIMGPGEYAILIATGSAPLFAFYQNVVLVTSFPSLNNSGDEIKLLDVNEEAIDQLTYDLRWYGDESKEDGGFSIEQINPFAACVNASNWAASAHPLGGTPGSQNSIYDDTPDTDGPLLVGVDIVDAQTLFIGMNEALSSGGITAQNITIDPSVTISSTQLNGPENTSFTAVLSEPIDTGIVYTLTITGLSDCEGNAQGSDSIRTFLLPFDADSGELVINEVLFNPFTGGSDYVEIANRTDRPLNLKGWLLANYDQEEGISNLRKIIDRNFSVAPFGYALITEDTINVMTNYIQHGIGNFIEMDMPSYNNDSGTVYLLRLDSTVAERFAYTEDMHFPLLSDVDGVSLERLDVNRPVNDMGNWHSAAETVGFGTPGLENSQFYPTAQAVGEVSMDPEIFSPDNDGYNDVLNINYSFIAPGFVGTVRIFDANGRPVRNLATNELLATTGTFTWDGTTDKGEKARIGMYIILFEAFSQAGDKTVHKLSTVLGGKL
ncbi:MAG: hypothetical protein EP314_08030 [Bacteroidetes bacterium]|nr:MAG: hypothetical protein EP314_08030 [Bacteroidota bacterium]